MVFLKMFRNRIMVLKKGGDLGWIIIFDNWKVWFNYEIEDMFEVGIELKGMEVKFLCMGKVNIGEFYVVEYNGEIWIYNVYIFEYL